MDTSMWMPLEASQTYTIESWHYDWGACTLCNRDNIMVRHIMNSEPKIQLRRFICDDCLADSYTAGVYDFTLAEEVKRLGFKCLWTF